MKHRKKLQRFKCKHSYSRELARETNPQKPEFWSEANQNKA